MSDNGKIITAALLGSVAANIFLAAFVLGRLTSPAAAPQTVAFPSGQMMQQGMGGPPPWMQGRGPGGPGMGGPGMGGPGIGGPGMPPPPPVFRPEDVFTAQEMQQAMQETQANFQKADALRADFANRLEQGTVSKDEVLKHFADMDAIMNSTKLKVQEKTAEKISTMPEDERKALAMRLKQRGGPPQGMNGMGGRPGSPTPPGMQGNPGMPGAQGYPGMQGAPGNPGMQSAPGMPGQGFGPGEGQPQGMPPGQPPGQGPGNGPPPSPSQ